MFDKIKKKLFKKNTSKPKEEKTRPLAEEPDHSKSDESDVTPKESDKKPEASVSEGDVPPAKEESKESRPALDTSKEEPEKPKKTDSTFFGIPRTGCHFTG